MMVDTKSLLPPPGPTYTVAGTYVKSFQIAIRDMLKTGTLPIDVNGEFVIHDDYIRV